MHSSIAEAYLLYLLPPTPIETIQFPKKRTYWGKFIFSILTASTVLAWRTNMVRDWDLYAAVTAIYMQQ